MSRARNTATDLVKLLNDSSSPLYVLDDERRIVYCNAACAQWMGIAADELMGEQCNYGASLGQTSPSAAGHEGLAMGLCPPPQVFSGQPQWAVVSRTLPSGEIAYRRAFFWPLGDGQDDSAAVIALLDLDDCPSDGARAADDDSRLHEEVARFRRLMQTRFALPSLLGVSPAIARARAQLELAAGNDANVLIFGPSGSGKEHAAKAIHYAAATVGPLVPMDCAVLEANLLRSSLRTAALRNSASKESAGTLLISDLDRMPAEAQSDLAELLATRALRMRVIATSTRSPAEAVAAGHLSHELACVLSTITIELPALAQRLEDLPLLAQAFLEEINALGKKQVAGFSPEALDRLAAYAWPGNLDELRARALESHDRARGGEVGVDDLPGRIHLAADAAAHPPRRDEVIVLEEFLSRVETELITRAMRRAKGNKSKAAKLLGLTRPRLYRRLVQLGLEQPDFREEPS